MLSDDTPSDVYASLTMRAIELIEADSCDQLGGKIAQAIVQCMPVTDVVVEILPVSGAPGGNIAVALARLGAFGRAAITEITA